MAPARTTDDDDPVTASYDIYLTPQQTSQLYLLQYPNRLRERPYNATHGSQPRDLRLKPKTGHIEVDIPLNTERNFNKYAGLKWGGSLKSAKETQNEGATFGLAGGLPSGKGGAGARRQVGAGGEVERENEMQNDLRRFYDAERNGRVMNVQTLGGQIVRHTGVGEEEGKPWYFVGAFKGDQLHLTRVEGTAQMRPQFHHVDAEAHREKLLASKNSQAGAEAATSGDVRAINQRVKEGPSSNPKGELEQREQEMEKALQDAREEEWVALRYVDEDDEEAFEVWEGRMFADEQESGGRLRSTMNDEGYLDAISAPGRESPTRRRRRRSRKSRQEDGDADGDVEDFEDGVS